MAKKNKKPLKNKMYLVYVAVPSLKMDYSFLIKAKNGHIAEKKAGRVFGKESIIQHTNLCKREAKGVYCVSMGSKAEVGELKPPKIP
jgi:hypothetical protein